MLTLLAILLTRSGPAALAQDPPPPPADEATPEAPEAPAPAGSIPALEEEVRDLERRARYVTARRKTDELLARDPQNLVGHFVMGRVQWLSEGNHARALYHLQLADTLYKQRYLPLAEDAPPDAEGRPFDLHSEVLRSLQGLAEEMGNYGDALALIEEYDGRFQPTFGMAERGWAHMRLGDMDAARAAAEVGIASEDVWQQVIGHNVLCAVEAAEGNREASFEACRAALEHRRERGQGSLAIAAGNASGGAIGVLDFPLAEEWAREGTNSGGNVTAWRRLILLLVDAGRMSEAVDALRALREAQAAQEPSMRDLNRADLDAAFARILLVAGESEKGMAVIDRALRYPDRRGLISTTEEQARGGHALLRLGMRQVAAERAREEASTHRLLTRIGHALRRLLPDSARWADEAAVRSTLADPQRLDGTFRVYLDDGLNDVPSWMMGDLVHILGAGVAAAALERARQQEVFAPMGAYYDAIEAEIALKRRDYADAAALADAALEALPHEEALLRARVHALAAVAAWRRGDEAASLSHYERVMQLDPGTMRRLGLALPARVEQAAGGEAAGKVANMLGRSPRLDHRSGGFVVSVEGDSSDLQIRIRTPLGAQLSCADAARPGDVPGEPPLTETEYARFAVGRFHDRAFAMPLGLSSIDMNSLDGTTATASEAERERLEEALEVLE